MIAYCSEPSQRTHSKMMDLRRIVLALCLLHYSLAVKVKMSIRSEEDSIDDDEVQPPRDPAPHKTKSATLMPFIRRRLSEKPIEFEEEKPTTEKKTLHPNDLLFPLIYKQTHINSMFKFGESWYTWSTEKRSDGSKAVSYYICYDEPKHCDDIGWERTDTVPKCAFQIDSLVSEDRACLNTFGVEPHTGAPCDGTDQMRVADIVKSCGPRIRSLWRFVRVGRRAANAPKPADVNSLVCEDEEECFVSVEYRIHRDRITYSLHEPTRGQTFKSALKRDLPEDATTTQRPHHARRSKKLPVEQEHAKKVRVRSKSKVVEGKGVEKETDSSYGNRRVKNKIKFREENISDDISE